MFACLLCFAQFVFKTMGACGACAGRAERADLAKDVKDVGNVKHVTGVRTAVGSCLRLGGGCGGGLTCKLFAAFADEVISERRLRRPAPPASLTLPGRVAGTGRRPVCLAVKGKAGLYGEGGRSWSAVLTDKAGCSGGSALGRRAAVMPGVCGCLRSRAGRAFGWAWKSNFDDVLRSSLLVGAGHSPAGI